MTSAADRIARPPLAARLRRASPVFGLAVAAIGALVLVGWATDSAPLKSVVPGMITMKVNTAVGLILLAAALVGVNRIGVGWRVCTPACLGAVALMALATLGEYAFDVDLRIDNVLFTDRESPVYPGRNAPATNVAFLGLAAALLLQHRRRAAMAAQVLMFVVASAPLVTLGGYLYRAPGMYRNAPYPAIALNTSVALFMLCLGGLFARADEAMMGVVTSRSLAGSLARKLLPAAVGLPLLTGLLVLAGERAGAYTSAFGSALLVASCAVFFGGAVCWAVYLLWHAEAQRAAAERARAASDRQVGEGEQRLRIALETARLGAWQLDLVTGAFECSARCKANFGVPPDGPFTHASLAAATHPDDRAAVAARMDAALRDRTDYHAEYRAVWPDGSVHWIVASGRGVYGDDGAAVRVVGVTLDVTATKAVEAERERLLQGEREARSAAERASRMKDEFLASVSHELRTPLNAILGWAHLCRTCAAPGDVAEALETIERNARAQARIVEDLLDMGRIVGGKERLDVRRVDLPAVVDAAVESMRPAADAKGVRLQRVIAPALPPVGGDPSRLQQVVWNLLSNAIKFTPRGGTVAVTLGPADGHVELAVADSGCGI
ncbi:MAG TPA: PAS domain-containing sensor histidine kinase, partial [Humisphaera sp.]